MKIGDFVTATLVGGQNGEPRQGVFVQDNGDGTIQVEGERETFTCLFDGAIVVADSGLFGSVVDHVQAVRQRLGLISESESGEIREVTLKNGSEIPEPLVTVTMVSLQDLIKSNPIAFYELVMRCRDRDHRLFGNTGEVLKSFALVESNGEIHDAVRDIVLSATEGEGLEMSLGSPLAVAA